jgi:hypothetical protein
MKKTIFMIAVGFLILGGIALGMQVFLRKNFLNSVFKQYAWIIFSLIGISALMIGFSRDTYLPFLGETVVPCSVLKDSIPENATHFAKVKVSPGAKVLYWAAEPTNDELNTLKDWRQAYLGFKNAGIVTADKDGIATLRFREPQPYLVGFLKQRLEAHVHYRSCANQGIMSRIETITTLQIGDYTEPKEEPVTESFTDDADTDDDAKDIEETTEDITSAMESFMNDVDEQSKQLPVIEMQSNYEIEGADSKKEKSSPELLVGKKESFMNYAPAQFESEKEPRKPTDDNTLYYLAEETEKNRIDDEMNGIDESPQPSGTEYSTAFSYTIPQ